MTAEEVEAATSFEPPLAALLDRLHGESEAQEETTRAYFARRAQEGTLSWEGLDEESHRFFADKLVALDRDKARFAFQLACAMRARRIVEVGASFGVSTLWLAAAVRETLRDRGGEGVVISCEHEPAKARKARAHFAEAGLAEIIDLREGDLRQTFIDLAGPIDLVLMDIWTEMARPAIELIAPHLRRGAVVLADNTGFPAPYKAFFAFINDPAQGFTTMTLPFSGGLEMSVKL